LHDVGKVTIPSEILSKHGKLTEIECSLVKGHARAGYDVLKRVALPWPIAEAALQHHERMNGSGYPQGLEGDDILFNAQIIAVADTIEAMTSDRPYRVGLGIEKTLAEIERGRGSLYNPTVVDCSLKLFREKGYKLPR
jgi:HD-GYP domain-containing protein (c-di-GMP phosphodiesterase class II)